jgi:hypothetical protein
MHLSVDDREVWCGVIKRTAFFLYQPQDDPSTLHFRYLAPEEGAAGEEGVEAKREVLRDYFQLSMSMTDAWTRYEPSYTAPPLQSTQSHLLYAWPNPHRWTAKRKKESKVVAHFEDACQRFRGMRTLRTDPVECLVPPPPKTTLLPQWQWADPQLYVGQLHLLAEQQHSTHHADGERSVYPIRGQDRFRSRTHRPEGCLPPNRSRPMTDFIS